MPPQRAGDAASQDGGRRLVSVVIPSFNRPATTNAAIASAIAQTYRPLEIVVVDDGSEPPFAVEPATTDDVALRIIRNERNLGAAASRQAGVDAARGAFVAFLDSDDTWVSEKLDRQMEILRK